MKEGWERKRVGEIAHHSLGKMLDKAKNKGEPQPYLRNLNVRWFEFDLSDLLKMRFLPDESDRYTAVRGDLLICEGGYPGRAAIWDRDEPIHFQKALHRVRFHQPEHTRWFLYYLHFLDLAGMLRQYFNGAGIQHLTGEALNQFEVPIAPTPEQQRIVRILDEAFDSIAIAKANAEKNLQNSRALFENHLQSVFAHRGVGWVEKRIGEIANHSLGKMLDKTKNRGELQRYLRNLNVRWFTFDLTDIMEMRFLPEENARYTAVKGDVLVCEGGYPGRAAIWTEDYPIYFQKALHRLRFHWPDHNRWFLYYLYSKEKGGDLRQYFTGTGIQHFTREALNRLAIPLPPPSVLQTLLVQFAKFDAQTQHLQSLYQQKLTALEALKKSLLHQAFTGNL